MPYAVRQLVKELPKVDTFPRALETVDGSPVVADTWFYRGVSGDDLTSVNRLLTPHDDVATAIARAIDEATFEVRDDATKTLAKIRRAIARTRERLDEKLAAILQKELAAGTVQEPSVHLRNGRRVLPIKRTARSKLKGMVDR